MKRKRLVKWDFHYLMLLHYNVLLIHVILYHIYEVWGKVIFLHLSVILFTRGGGVPGQEPSPLGRYTPLAGTSPGQVHPSRYTPPGRYTPWAGTPPSRYTPCRYTPQQVHPLAGTPPKQVHPQAGTPPPPVHAGIRSTSGRYASYWNAFLWTVCILPYLYIPHLHLALEQHRCRW